MEQPAPATPPTPIKAVPLRRSCEACRLSKSRCISSPDSNRCQRCFRDSKECVFAHAKQRSKRARTAKAKVVEMEQRLADILTLLSGNNAGAAAAATTPLNPPSSHSSTADMTPSSGASDMPSMAHDEGCYRWGIEKVDVQSRRKAYHCEEWHIEHEKRSEEYRHRQGDVIDKGIISITAAEAALSSFRTAATHFPFVIFRQHESLAVLRNERPVALLSALAMASSNDCLKQDHIDQEFREVIAQRVTVKGEASLDLVQGMLLYTTWSHFYLRPGQQVMFQISQMAVSMASDLGYGKPRNKQSPYMDAWNLPTITNLDTMRAYLGCYYLSSSLSQSLRRPTTMKFSNHMGDCCKILAEANDAWSDQFITPLVHIQRLVDDVSNTFNYDGYHDLPPLSRNRIEMQVGSFVKQHHQIGLEFRNEISQSNTLTVAHLNLHLLIHEIAFHSIDMEDRSPNSWLHSQKRAETVITCVDSATALLDAMIAADLEVIRLMTIPVLSAMVYAILLLIQVVTTCGSPHIDADSIQQRINLPDYLERLKHILAQVLSEKDREISVGSFYHMSDIFGKTKGWLEAVKEDKSLSVLFMSMGPSELNVFAIMKYSPDISFRALDAKVQVASPEDSAAIAYPGSWMSLDLEDANWPFSEEQFPDIAFPEIG